MNKVEDKALDFNYKNFEIKGEISENRRRLGKNTLLSTNGKKILTCRYMD
ncbi:hypothetical protein [Stygiolobus caldivivus]|nr:hypothetical protein [Stygiolobus caldivivus]